MPGWVIPISPLDELEKANNGKVTASPRAWLANENEAEIMFINPAISEGKVFVPMGFVGDKFSSGELEFTDIDTGEKFTVTVSFSESIGWFSGHQFYL